MTGKAKKNLLILLTVFSIIWGFEEFFRRKVGGLAGTYPFVEYWDLIATEEEVINAIIELKKENPGFQPPNQKELISARNINYDWQSQELKNNVMAYFTDSLPLPPKTKANTKSDYWRHIDFYYPDTKEIVHTWTRPDLDTTITRFALVSLSSIEDPTEYSLINRDFWYIANRRQIRRFKTIIVEKVQENIEKKRKSGT